MKISACVEYERNDIYFIINLCMFVEWVSLTYKILSKTLLSSLTPYVEEITGDNQWDFDAACSYWSYNLQPSNAGIKWKYYESVHQLLIDIQKAYDSVKREVLYNILNQFSIPMNWLG